MSEIISLLQDNDTNASTTSGLGAKGEQLAQDYLFRRGLRIVCSNFKTQVGRNRKGVLVNGEIDLIAYDQNTLCFIEVKTRTSDWFAPPQANVDLRKRRQIARAAHAYRKLMDLDNDPYRFDVVTVLLSDPLSPQIDLIRNYFAL